MSDITYEELIQVYRIYHRMLSLLSDITYEELIPNFFQIVYLLATFIVGHYLSYKDSLCQYIRQRHYFYLKSMNAPTC